VPDNLPHILIAEKDPHVRHFVSHILSSVGYGITEAANAKEALRALADPLAVFDAIVIHEHMDEMSGTAVLRVARCWGVEIPAIIVSGAMTSEAQTFAAADRRVKLLDKPVLPHVLIQTLFELIGARPTS